MKSLIFSVLFFNTMVSFSQDNNSFILKTYDTSYVYHDTNQIITWVKNIHRNNSIQTTSYIIDHNVLFLIKVDICSGIYCPNYYYFVQRNNNWKLVANCYVNFNYPIDFFVNYIQEMFLFKANNQILGTIPFKLLTNK